MTLKQLDKFHKTRTSFAVFGIIELGLAYLFGSLAVNSGSLWEWALAIILLVGAPQNIVRLIEKCVHDKKAS
jgi:hypothetical protein